MTSIQTSIKISDACLGDTIVWYERGRAQKAHVQNIVRTDYLTYIYVQGVTLAIEFDSEFEVAIHRDIIAEPQGFGERVNIAGPWWEAIAVRTNNQSHPWACSNGSDYDWDGLNKLGWVTLPDTEVTE